MIWAGHVARLGGGEMCTGFWLGKLRARDHLEEPGVDGRNIYKDGSTGCERGRGLDRCGSG